MTSPIKNNRNLGLLLAVAGLVAAAALTVTLRNQDRATPAGPAGALREIRTQRSDSPDSSQDIIEFTDGTRLENVGYDIILVGSITLPEAPPVYLFKTYSCRGCEPKINLLVYSPQSKQKVLRPYPGQHVLMDENQHEIPDAQVAAVFGSCDGALPLVLIAIKTRDADSDGMSVQGSPVWQMTTTKLTVDSKGFIQTVEAATDSFFEVQKLAESGCKKIEPEDRLDYL